MYYNGLASTAAKSVANTAIICDFIINNKDIIIELFLLDYLYLFGIKEKFNFVSVGRADLFRSLNSIIMVAFWAEKLSRIGVFHHRRQ